MDIISEHLILLFILIAAGLPLSSSASSRTEVLKSVPDLEQSMYVSVDGYPCVRLLNLSGEIGCSNPGRGNVIAPIVRFKGAEFLTEPSSVVVSLDEFKSLFARISNDSTFARHVAGVLVESGTVVQKNLKEFSPDNKFPQAEFAPYRSHNFEWNPFGSGDMWKAYNFPVFLLTESSTLTVQEITMKNEKQKKSYTADVTEFDLVMQTTKSGTHNSESCLQEHTCLPLGGYSVWSALPPLNTLSSEKSKPIILAMASMDSASFFRDKSVGADSPLSGLIALLAAVDALSHLNAFDELSKQLVFVVFTGEAWGYLGSRRFLLELDQNSDAVKGLNFSMVESILEIGSVGKSLDQKAKTFFVHTTGEMSALNETLDALQHAKDSIDSASIKISPANPSNPGIPPSSLMSFLRKRADIPGVVMEDFDTGFTNKFYHSHLDDLSNINSSVIVDAASLVARTLYILGSDNRMNASTLTSINVNSSLVDELLGCLLNCEPGLSCGLVKRYISPSSTCPSNYVGVILGEPSSSPYPSYVADVARFLWNFLADRTSIPPKNSSSACPNDCSSGEEMCVKKETDGNGICVISTTRYVPAYSTRLKFEDETWTILPNNSSDLLGDADPVWTESNWDTIKLRVYTVQDSAYDSLILILGTIVTVLAYIIIVATRSFITKSLKQD